MGTARVHAERDGTVKPNRAERRRAGRGLATRPEVASYLGVPVATMTQWAYKRVGPPYRIIGRHARYVWDEVDDWVESRAVGGGAA